MYSYYSMVMYLYDKDACMTTEAGASSVRLTTINPSVSYIFMHVN